MRIKWLFIALGLITLAVVWHFNLPGSVTNGSPTDVSVFVFLIGCGVFSGVLSLQSATRVSKSYRDRDGVVHMREGGGSDWHLPDWMSGRNNEEEQLRKLNKEHEDAHAAYRAKFHRALNPNEKEER